MEIAAALHIVRPESDATPSGAARVFAFFRDRLLSGELKAGDRLLAERELALALGVSRPVLREALHSLAMLGLLDIQHGRGAFVRTADASVLGRALTLCLAPEPNILDDVLQARIAIECQAIRLACERASERSASRSTGRLTPSASANSRSASSRSPAFNSPARSRSRKKVKTRAAPLCVSSAFERTISSTFSLGQSVVVPV